MSDLELREIERPSGMARVLAPRAMSDAQVEAWLDWGAADSQDLPLGGGPDRYVETLKAAGQAQGVFPSPEAAQAFAEALRLSMLSGAGAPGGARIQARVGSGPADLDAHLAEARAAAASAQAVEALGRRLQAVMDAVARCEGDAEACADPRRNAALARAVRAALEAGAAEGRIHDVIALARAGERLYALAPAATHSPLLILPADSVSPLEAARAAWETGGLLLTLRDADVPAVSAAVRGPVAGLRVDLLDEAALAAHARVWAKALKIEAAWRGAPGGALTLGGVHEALVARGLAYDSKAGRGAAAALVARVEEAAPGCLILFEDADLTLRLGVATGLAPWAGRSRRRRRPTASCSEPFAVRRDRPEDPRASR
jgi:ribonucleoside-diphosphate reductase alpha chain